MGFKNKRRKSSKIQQLMERDAQVQAERAARVKVSEHVWQQSSATTQEDSPVSPRQSVGRGRIRPRPHAQPTGRP